MTAEERAAELSRRLGLATPLVRSIGQAPANNTSIPKQVVYDNNTKTILFAFSNKALVEEHPQAWTDDDIATRGVEMTKRLCGVWRR